MQKVLTLEKMNRGAHWYKVRFSFLVKRKIFFKAVTGVRACAIKTNVPGRLSARGQNVSTVNTIKGEICSLRENVKRLSAQNQKP